jgi:hypothetical protein
MVVCRSIEEILERVTMDDFSDYGNYDAWLRANVISMWDYLYRQREPSVVSQKKSCTWAGALVPCGPCEYDVIANR